MILNCIAVDDEPPALDLIRRFIGQTPFLKLTESFDNAIEALSFIGKNPVDLIFLDIQMPDLSGIELARILSNRNMQDAPAIIFTTAFDQFAVEGYKLNVIDYLLKPFGYEDFVRAATKAMKFAEITTKPEEASSSIDDYIYLKVEFQIVKIACDNISHIEGLKDYAKIYLIDSEKPVLSLITLKAIEDKLQKEKFMRIHRSTIISLDKVTSVTKNSVSIGTGTYNVSEQYKDDFARFYITWK
ncbi:response regulator transcription factor [Mucilaginibacter sp. RB4R14]|uniref:LytR/AlgR family response regulator transcription factor n=1 Tax=Mucilaginibacter aurantiaciroseus TaxID=2949308 RepID=UPI0020906331|nr:response regulator transcription factor [Mucilaginibacter aurantiaciroseus]MCO5934004.1 response regulator transcription factor [Mucilaginibacter aurantiaciroseus]